MNGQQIGLHDDRKQPEQEEQKQNGDKVWKNDDKLWVGEKITDILDAIKDLAKAVRVGDENKVEHLKAIINQLDEFDVQVRDIRSQNADLLEHIKLLLICINAGARAEETAKPEEAELAPESVETDKTGKHPGSGV